MDRITGKPNNLQDYLVTVRDGQWFGFENLNGNEANKTYANLIVLDGGSKPTEQECTDGLSALQTAWDDKISKIATDKTNANDKLKALGLTDDEIKAIKGIE
jgi:hypothetical protein|tara:strand:+ start:199 stop:504 length:306 start_codon:yes stop_codon:yes gene_type:complete